MVRLVLFATFAAALVAATVAPSHAFAVARADAVDDELRAYDQLLKPTGDALAAIKCDARDCVPALLAAMRGHDQAIRRGVQTIKLECEKLDEAAKKRCADGVQKRSDQSDRANSERLKQIVDKYGWPSTKEFGEAAEAAAWLIALHADHDRPFQRHVLQLLERSTASGESPERHRAFLYDRIAVADHKPQRWGTQGRCVANKWEPFPIEDADTVDQRRSAAGMAPMATYRSAVDPTSCAGKN
ncbi:DUF6624 domain-containing protein [Roseiterribacter gracilis]|uniref:Uncharacterized protein n=1 Tax=Roseiterribacter gracilis TaxID=2812848 RepID=A0A8S8XIG8_9PROT|nr:hypothetical protein TMPK1_40390 [Rhodospirillales bacterium TMPK1]